jgi:hypothetical protein
MSFEAIIIGCVTGFVSAFFGIGGSSIDTPLLRTFLHLPPYIALGSPLPTALLTVAIALATYWKKHLVDSRVFIWSVAGGLPGIVFGAYLSQKFSGQFLMLLTALVLFSVGADFISKKFIRRKKIAETGEQKNVPAPLIVIVAFLASILSGILAIGGGLFFIPIYVLLFGMDIKKAIVTSLSVIAVIILPSCLIHAYLGHIDFGIAAALSIGVIPAAYLGAKLDMGTDAKTIQSLFGLLLVLFSIYFFISQMMN